MKEISTDEYCNRLDLLMSQEDMAAIEDFKLHFCIVDRYVDPVFKKIRVSNTVTTAYPHPPRNLNIILN